MMFQNALARFKDDDNPRLHRIPFSIIWVASYGLAWFALVFVSMIRSDMWDAPVISQVFNWVDNHAEWINSLGMGLSFGLMLSLIQTWLIRRRYGFVPKFWRITTILGSTLTGLSFPFSAYYWDYTDMWLPVLIWFSLLNIFQALSMFRVNRQAWLLALVGIIAGLVASGVFAIDSFRYEAELWSMLLGCLIQAFGTSVIMLRLMANPREGVIPKRDTIEKAKTRVREGLHPMTFIGFWTTAHFMGWVAFFVLMLLWFITIGETSFGYAISDWFDAHAEWAVGAFLGISVGITSAIAQPWLMKQHSKVEVRHWLLLSVIGWAIAGTGFWYYTDSYNLSLVEKSTFLILWFATPTLFQTVSMWRAMRGGWIWAGTGVATAIIAILIDTQLAWSYNETFYAIMLGGLAQAIITGSTFILLQSQQKQQDTLEALQV